jgi:hypothetical protein
VADQVHPQRRLKHPWRRPRRSLQLRIIDDLVKRTDAPSRSALVNAALDATLPPGHAHEVDP